MGIESADAGNKNTNGMTRNTEDEPDFPTGWLSMNIEQLKLERSKLLSKITENKNDESPDTLKHNEKLLRLLYAFIDSYKKSIDGALAGSNKGFNDPHDK